MSETRAMAEQAILKILWPPDGKFSWEDRFKVADVERALKNLLDAVEKEPVRTNPAGNEAISQKMADLKALGYSETQIARQMDYTPNAVHKRLDGLKKRMQKQTANSPGVPVAEEAHRSPGGIQQDVKTDTAEPVRTGSEIPFSCHHENGRVDPAALRSAAPDQLVEANKMIAAADPAESKPPVSDATLRNVPPIKQVGREVEQVPGQAALQEAKPEQNENPTIRKDRMVEESAKVRPEKVPLTDEQKAKILDLHGKGFDIQYIKISLGILDGRLIQGTIMGAKRRKTAENVPVVQSSDIPAPSTKDVMLLQQPANVTDTSAAAPKPTEDKPAPKAIGRAELDAKIWALWKEGKSPAEISDIIWDEGYYYNEKSVVIRLRSQGANL